MMKVNTVEQFHIMRHISENFYIETLKIDLIDKNRVHITDRTGESAVFTYNKEKNEVQLEEN